MARVEGAAAPAARTAGSSGVTEPEQRILDSLAWWRAAGVEQPTRHQVAFGAKYTVNGHFNNTLGGLRAKALVDYPTGGRVKLTDEGFHSANVPETAASRADLIERAEEVLREEPQRRLFAALVTLARTVSRDALATAAGYTVNGHFNNTLGALRSIGLVRYPGRGTVGLGEMFEV